LGPDDRTSNQQAASVAGEPQRADDVLTTPPPAQGLARIGVKESDPAMLAGDC